MSGIFKNRYKIKEETFTEITRMSEVELATAMENYYLNWQTVVDQKKKDPRIKLLVDQRKDIMETINKDSEVVELTEKLKQLKFEKTTEELARIDSELSNERQPVNEDIKTFRSLFYTCADIKTKRFKNAE